MTDPRHVSPTDLQKYVHELPLAIIDMLDDTPEREVIKSHIRLAYAKALIHFVRKQNDD